MSEFASDLLAFSRAVVKHWGVLVSGAVLAVLGLADFFFSGPDVVDKRTGAVRHHPFLSPWVFAGAVSLMVVWACFAAWRDMKAERDELLDRRSIDLEFEQLAPSEIGVQPGPGLPARPQLLVSFLVRNLGVGAHFTATVVSKSVKGVGEEYPDGSFLLRWQTPNDSERQWIGQGGDARVDVAQLDPLNDFRFLGPEVVWKMLRPQGEVDGLIDLEDVDHDARQRVAFGLSMGSVNPVALTVVAVASPHGSDSQSKGLFP